MLTATTLNDVVARWGTMYGGFFGLAVVLAVILLILDILAPILIFFDAKRQGRNPVGWMVSILTLPIIASLPAIFFILYSPIIGPLALAMPLPVMAVYLFVTTAARKARVCPSCGRELQAGWDGCPFCSVGQPAYAVAGVQQAAVAGPGPAGALSAPPAAPQQVQAAVVEAQAVAPAGAPAPEPGTRYAGGAPLGLFGLLVVTTGVDRGREFRLDSDVLEIGREPDCPVRLSDSEISRRHAKIRLEGGRAKLYDLASTNGTFLNGSKVSEAELHDGDTVRIGATEMVVKLIGPPTPEAGPGPKAGTIVQPAAKPGTVVVQPGGWTGRIEGGPDAGRTFPIGALVVLGRDDDCDVVLTDGKVSRKHARLSAEGGGVQVEDLESSNGTEIVRPDGVAVKVRPGRAQPVAAGEKVRVGDTEIALLTPG